MKWYREITGVFRTSLGRKLTVPVFLMLALFSLPFFFAYHMEQVVDRTSSEVSDRNEAIDHVNAMDGALNHEQVEVYAMVYEHRPEMIESFKSTAAEVQFWHDQAMEHVDGPEERAALDECQALHDRAQSTVLNQIAPVIQSPNLDHMMLIPAVEELRASYQRMSDLGNQVRGLFTADRQAASLSREESRELASEMMRASIIVAVLLGFCVAGYHARRLVLPIKRLAEASLQVARGDLSQRVEARGRDELAEMGRSFNDMADSLERRTGQLEREKSRIRSIHQSIGDGIVVVDRGGVIVSVNPAAESILGKPVTQLERTTNTGVPELQEAIIRRIAPEQMVKCWEAKNCQKADCPSHGSNDRRCWLQCGTFCYNQIQGTFRQKRDACERCDVFKKNAVQKLTLEINGRYYSTSVVPILDDEGQEEGRSIAMHDITDMLLAKEATERHSAELAAINSVGEAVSESLDLQTTVDNALEMIQRIRSADAVAIHLIDEGGSEMHLAAQRGLPDGIRQVMEKIPVGFGCPGVAVETGGPVAVNDLREHEDVPQEALDAGFLSSMAVPLKSKNKIIGSLSLATQRLNAFTEDDTRLMSLIGSQVGVAVENSILYEDSLWHTREALAKNRIVSTLTSTMELEKVFDEFAEEIGLIVDFDRIGVIIADSDGTNLKVLLPTGFEPALDENSSGEIAISGTTVEWVMKNRRPYICDDISSEIKFREQAGFVKLGLKSQLNIPLIVKEKVLGSLNLVSAETAAYNEDTAKRLQPVVDQVALAVANQKLFEDVAQAKNEWETTFDSASEGIAVISKDYRIARLNKAAAAMMGGTVEDFLNRRCYEVLHEGGEKPNICLMKESISGLCSSRSEQEMQDGRTLEIVVDAVNNDRGEPVGAVHFLRDITEAKRLRQQLLQSEKMIAVGQLVAGVAHEINNPLTGVMGYSQLLLARDIDDQAKKDAEGIYREAERATRIVRHLLSFARMHQPERRPVDINATLRESVELKAYELRVNNILLETDLDAGLPMTNADPHQLQQVFLNLITNAEQAMLEDRGSGLLKISTQLAGDKIRIVFADNGPGIPAGMRDRVFDPFFTTKDVGKGTGLGLSVCYGVAEDHGGSVWAEPTQDRGATIIMELPVVAAGPVQEEQEKHDIRKQLGKILLVDDEAAIRQVLTETLRQAGHDVETARNGEVALRMLKQKHYDCIVSDVKMPGMDGPALHRAVQKIDPVVAGSFIFISGDTVSPETSSYLEHVDNPRLAKPFNMKDLEKTLQSMLASRGGGNN
jgi:two-component system NtrC family sensor kinase